MSKVLIVAPDKETINLYKAAITFQGIDTITATRAEESLKMLDEHPSLILLDIMTPDLNKVNLINEIQKRTKGEVPLIIIADMREDADLYSHSIEGACEYLFKSETSVGDIIRKVRTTIDKKK